MIGYIFAILAAIAGTAAVCGGVAGWMLYRISARKPGTAMLLQPNERRDRYAEW